MGDILREGMLGYQGTRIIKYLENRIFNITRTECDIKRIF